MSDSSNSASAARSARVPGVTQSENERLKQQAAFVINNPAPVMQATNDGRILDFNPAAESIFGEHLFERSIFDILTGLDPATLAGLADGGSYQIEMDIEDRTFIFTLVEDRQTELFFIYGADVTVRKRAEEALEERRVFLEAVLECIAEGIVACDREGTLAYFNRATCEFHGLPAEPIPPEEWASHYDLYEPDGKTPLTRERIPLFRALMGEEVSSQEMVIVAKGLPARTLIATGRTLADSNGNPLGAVVSMNDITMRKWAEQMRAIRELQQIAIAEFGQLALVALDLSSLLNEAVSTVAWILKVECCEVLELLPSGKAVLLRASVGWKEGLMGQATLPTGLDSQAGYTLQSRESIVVEDLTTETRFTDPALLRDHNIVSGMSTIIGCEESPWGVLGAHSVRRRTFSEDDINFMKSVASLLAYAIERERAEEILATEAIRRRILMDQSRDGIVVLDQDGSVYESNQRFAEMLGFSPEEVSHLHVWDWEFQFTREQVQDMLRNIDETGNNFETQHRRKDGTTFNVEISTNGAVFAGKKLIFCVCRDITERKQMETTLKESEERYRTMFECSAGGIAIANVKTKRFTYVNLALCKMLGYTREELAAMGVSDIHPQDALEHIFAEFEQQARGDKTLSPDIPCLRKDGTIVYADVSTTSVMLGEERCNVGFFTDISERKQLELEITQARKLEAVGSLAAGIAHEINTPIQFVGDNTHFLADSFDSLMALVQTYQDLWQKANGGADLAELASEIVSAEENADLEYLKEEIPNAVSQTLDGVQRVTKIVRAMKDFAHSDQGAKSMVAINDMLASTLTVARNELKYVADVETAFDPGLPQIECYRDDLNQVFLNLLVNGAHAIADVIGDSPAGKGTITVATSREGDNIVIKISDTGSGIPKEIQHRIFDQFFTTKDVGKGSGQGLAIARAIITDKHQGGLTFETEEGQGTTFIIRLPITTPELVEA